MEATARRFTALARSSPWRWATLRFRFAERLLGRSTDVRAWVRRPDALRVERLDGTPVLAQRSERPWGWSQRQAPDGTWVPDPPFFGPRDPQAPRPELDSDGLVVARPAEWGGLRYDDPMYVNYRWVAMLDPAELADGRDDAPVEVVELAAVDHHGRPAWEAVLRPTDAYEPRCSCCALLLSAQSDAYETAAGGPSVRNAFPDLRFADAHRVRLDVGTGVCVHTAEIGGDRPGDGHDVVIEGVDEPMGDALFTPGR